MASASSWVSDRKPPRPLASSAAGIALRPSLVAFTPWTTPSSRSQLGGGWPVWITNIRRREDGRIEFTIGVEYR